MEQASNIEQGQQLPIFDKLLIMDRRFNKEIAEFLKETYKMQDLPHLVSQLRHKDPIIRHRAAIGIRKLLSNASEPANQIQQAIDAGVVPPLILLVKQIKYPHLRLEAAWALGSIAYYGDSKQCQQIIDHGGISTFIKLLKGKKFKLIENAIWGIGNISATSYIYRDMLIEQKAIDNIIKIAKRICNQKLLKLCFLAISNLCRGIPLPKSEEMNSGTLFLCDVIAKGKISNLQAINDGCWAISYHMKLVLKSNKDLARSLIARLMTLCANDPLSLPFIVPAIRIFGLTSCSTVEITNILIQQNVLSLLNTFLKHSKKVVRREVCWVISNIAAGSEEQVLTVIQENGLIKNLVGLLEKDVFDVKREICFIFKNFTYRGDPKVVCSIYEENNIAGLCYRLLEEQDYQTMEIALQSIDKIVSFAYRLSRKACCLLLAQLKREGAPVALQKLQCCQSDLVIDIVKRLIMLFKEETNIEY